MYDKFGEFFIVAKVIVLYIATMFGYFSFDWVYIQVAQQIPINHFREFVLDIKELVSLIFSIIVTIVALFKLIKYVREYKSYNNQNEKNS